MLQVIRDRAQGVFAWLIVGMISIPFALWGINSYFGGGGDEGVAEVGGIKITSNQLQRTYQQQRDRLAQMFGGKLPENLFSEETMKKQALQQLIDKEVLVQAAKENGMAVGDNQLGTYVKGIDVFYSDGKFEYEQYERVLARQGMSPKLFENLVRRDMIAGQLNEIATDTEFSLPSEIDAQLSLQLQQRDVGYMVLPVSKYLDGITVTEEEARNYYDGNSSRFMQPEQIKVDYLELKSEDIAAGIEVSDEQMRQRYETQKLNFRTPEERSARHILIKVAADAKEDEVKAAQAKAEAILQRIQGGEDFAQLAIAESQDPGSARNGGDLGFFGLGVMDKTFEKATFALKVGEVSELVRSAFGFHIIKLEAIKGGETKPYEMVADELKREIQNERASEMFFDKAEQLASLTYEQSDTLKVAAEQLQLPIKSSDYFSRGGGTGIASNPKIIEAAFSDDVLLGNHNSESIELENNHLVVLRINDHKPEKLRPFEEVRTAIEGSLKKERAQAAALETAKDLLSKMDAGRNPETLASALAVEWKREADVMRDNKKINRAIVQELFRMPHPVEGRVASRQITLPGGDQAVLQLFGVKQGDVAKAEEKARNEVATRIERANAAAADKALIAGLRERAEITINK